MKLKGVIFDLDGTLANTFPVIFPAYRKAYAQVLDRYYSDQDIVATFGPTEVGTFKNEAGDHWEACLQVYMEEYQRLSQTETILFPGLNATLEMLKQRSIKLGVVTGKSYESAIISLKDMGMSEYFDDVEGGSIHGVIKPECMRRILKKWELSPVDVAYVGDMVMDMKNAKEVGVVPLGAAWCRELAEVNLLAKENPAAIFEDVASFRLWMEEHINGKH
jgi:pyrophosphatase PpaX